MQTTALLIHKEIQFVTFKQFFVIKYACLVMLNRERDDGKKNVVCAFDKVNSLNLYHAEHSTLLFLAYEMVFSFISLALMILACKPNSTTFSFYTVSLQRWNFLLLFKYRFSSITLQSEFRKLHRNIFCAALPKIVHNFSFPALNHMIIHTRWWSSTLVRFLECCSCSFLYYMILHCIKCDL